jgi:predicted permease
MIALDQQRQRSRRRTDLFSDLRQDVAYGCRALRRNLTLTTVIVMALAIGIGANTAVFTLIDALLLRPIAVAHPEQLVTIGDEDYVNSSGIGTPHLDVLSAPLFRDLREKNDVFSDVLATGPAGRISARIGDAAELERPRSRYVSANFFSVLGVRASLGRTFDTRIDDAVGASPVVTISHAYWVRRFQGDSAVIGRQVLLNDVGMTIVGVAAPTFNGEVVGQSVDIWLPLSMHDALRPADKVLDRRSAIWLLAIGRLKPGVTLETARQRLEPLLRASIIQNASPQVAKSFESRPQHFVAVPGGRGLSEVRVTFKSPLFTVLAGVALLLCIMCANVANLLLARGVARGREMAVRLALGANRSRLVRQLLTESAVLALLGACAGLTVAWSGSRALLALAGDGEAIPLSLQLDARALAFTLAVSIAAVVVFGLVPSLRASRVDLASTFRGTGRALSAGGLGRRLSLSAWLVASQIALSAVVLSSSAMLVRSLNNVSSAETGLDREHLLIASVDITARGRFSAAELATLTHRLVDGVSGVPGVASVSLSENGIFSGSEWSTEVQVPGFVARSGEDSVVATDQIGAGYVRTVGARIVAGRDLGASDEDRPLRVALVNDALARFYFPQRSAVGQSLRFDDTVVVQIVGVVADVRDHDLAGKPRRRVYFPYLHRGAEQTVGTAGSLRLIARTSGDPSALVQSVRRAIAAVDPHLPIERVDPLTSLMRATIREERLLARVASGFGALALALSVIGLYGLMTYAITRRTGEIGVRVALGASATRVASAVLADALKLVALGLVIGIPLAFAAARALQSQLHDVSPVDPLSLGGALAVLTATATVAALLPARRAAKISPMEALRAD